jgi:type IV pilus assembly protein PilA
MFCPRCGLARVSSGGFCSGCGAQLEGVNDPTSAATAPVPLKRPGSITLLAVLQFVGAAIWLIVVIALAATALSGDMDATATGGAVFLTAVAALQLMCGIGLWKLRPYGRNLQIGFAVIGLLGVPLGTIISILILVYLFKPGIKAIFSGKPSSEFTPDEISAIRAITEGSGAATALIVVGVAIVAIVAVGIVAAIAIPGLLRARMAGNEASAIGSLRAISSAQASYASAGRGGYAVSLRRLSAPCPGTSQGFIGPDLSQDPSVRSGFTLALASAGAGPGPLDCNGAATQVDYYATAVPVIVGSTGGRGFATSAAGTIFFDPAGSAPGRSETLEGTARPVRR